MRFRNCSNPPSLRAIGFSTRCGLLCSMPGSSLHSNGLRAGFPSAAESRSTFQANREDFEIAPDRAAAVVSRRAGGADEHSQARAVRSTFTCSCSRLADEITLEIARRWGRIRHGTLAGHARALASAE